MMIRKEFLKRMAFAAAACAFLDVTLPRLEPERSTYNIEDYRLPADGDNWYPAMQRAIDAAARDGGIVWYPAGTYWFHQGKRPAIGEPITPDVFDGSPYITLEL